MSYVTTAHVDGACAQNTDKIGGWAVVLNHGEKSLSGYDLKTTNNRMELVAIRAAITLAPTNMALDIRSDSEWAINCLNGKNKAKKNLDLLKEISDLIEQREKAVTLTWIPRNSEPSHEKADRMAKNQVLAGRKALEQKVAEQAPEGLDNGGGEE